MSVYEVSQMLGIDETRVRAVGSRVTCDPPPLDTDLDVLVLLDDDPTALLMKEGYYQQGMGSMTDPNSKEGFRSFRSNDTDINIITTQSPDFFHKFILATNLAKRLNIMDKEDRIALFQGVLYQNDVTQDNPEMDFPEP